MAESANSNTCIISIHLGFATVLFALQEPDGFLIKQSTRTSGTDPRLKTQGNRDHMTVNFIIGHHLSLRSS